MIQKNASKKNVLIVTTTFPRWQDDYYSSFVFDLSRCLADDFHLIVLAPAHPGAKSQEEIAKLLVYRFNYFWPKKFQLVCYNEGIVSNLKRNKILWLVLPFLFFSQFIGILRLIKKEKIDLIHAHWFFPSGLTAILAAKIFKKPVIVTGHGSDLNLGGSFPNKIKKNYFTPSSSNNRCWAVFRPKTCQSCSQASSKNIRCSDGD